MKPVNPNKVPSSVQYQNWQEGFDAAIEWLKEPCNVVKGYEHRYLYPEYEGMTPYFKDKWVKR